MPYNGTGTFNRIYSWAVDAATSVAISSSRTDAEMNGFAAALTNCITRDGQSPPSADLPMGGKKIANLGLATVAGDALSQAAGDARYLLLTGGWTGTLPFTSAAAAGITLQKTGANAGTAQVYNDGGLNLIAGAATQSIFIRGDGINLYNFAATLLFQVDSTGNVILKQNNKSLGFTDANGGNPIFVCQADNNFCFYGTDAAGALRAVCSVGMHSSTAPFVFSIAVQGVTPSTADNSTLFATTAYVQANLASYQSLTPRVQSVASAATVTPTAANDEVVITAQAAGLTLANPSGSPVQGQGIVIRIKDNGTPRTIAYGAQYRSVSSTALPATTVASKLLYLGMIWNNDDSKWDVISVVQQP